MITHVIAIVSLAIATIIDIKKREVPDTLSYGTIILGVVIAIMSTVETNSWQPIISSGIALLVATAIAAIMFFSGQWGGGDAKLIIGLALLFGASSFFWNFLIMIIFAGAIYGILYGAYLAFKRREVFTKEFKKLIYNPKVKWARFAFQIVLATALLLAFFVIEDFGLKVFFVVFSGGMYLVFYAWIFSKALDSCMKVRVKAKDLVEGDWVIEPIKMGKKTLEVANFGITKSQIEQVQKAKVKNVLVKEGIPFVPSFALAYVFSLIIEYYSWSFFF